MSTFIERFDTSGEGIRLAVKDLIDMEGVPTTAGCRAVARRAEPAAVDAACMAGSRAAGARVVGRTNLHELALGVTGINPWYGTPVNPLDKDLVPGGSSSGSAVAVANDDADVAFGSDTGGSVRIPSACCGTTGLKTTTGRISLEGVWPLSPSFDTVGPMGRDVGAVIAGMRLLEPGFEIATTAPLRVGVLTIEADPAIEQALDEALRAVEWELAAIEIPEWDEVSMAAGILLVHEAWMTNRNLVALDPDNIGADVRERLDLGRSLGSPESVASARAVQLAWDASLSSLFDQFDLLATPTLTIFPPVLGGGEELLVARCTLPVNLGGVPALSLPIPTGGPLPTSLQLIGPRNSEERLCAAGLTMQACAESLA